MDASQQRDLVRRGYDAISRAYRDEQGRSSAMTAENLGRYETWLEDLGRLLEPSSRVLDLGCGCGLPASRLLVETGFEVVGLDFSHVQIERARRLVPQAEFVEADMAVWNAGPGSFDAVVSLYALIHLPLKDQQDLLPRIRAWLRPGGLFLAIVGHGRWTGVEDYLGAPMFWDHADAATYLDWLEGAGLKPIWDRYVPEGAAGHTLVLARAINV
ncbi:MAG: methyltransferase domain-containing protein [Candidatus Dormibacteraeota bacterium]|nr:methyltransferase domain-containing protein [Candidatus Dormibacteraeota bacterium]